MGKGKDGGMCSTYYSVAVNADTEEDYIAVATTMVNTCTFIMYVFYVHVQKLVHYTCTSQL